MIFLPFDDRNILDRIIFDWPLPYYREDMVLRSLIARPQWVVPGSETIQLPPRDNIEALAEELSDGEFYHSDWRPYFENLSWDEFNDDDLEFASGEIRASIRKFEESFYVMDLLAQEDIWHSTPIGKLDCVHIISSPRSGSSLLAQICYRLGLYFGTETEIKELATVDEAFLTSAYWNPSGNWEHRVFHKINRAAVIALGGGPYGVRPPPFIPGMLDIPQKTVYNAIQFIANMHANADGRTWCIKDPRGTSLLSGLWNKLIPNARYILSYRHPMRIADSMMRTGIDSRPFAEYMAYTFNYMLFQFLSELGPDEYEKRVCVIEYDRWFTDLDAQIEELAQFLGVTDREKIQYAANIINKEYRHF